MSTIKAVIFDWAGTTIDFGCMAPVQAFVDAFKAWKIDVTLDETRAPMGMNKRDHIETMLNMPRIGKLFQDAYAREFTQNDIDSIYAEFESNLFKQLHAYTTPKPYVLDTVSRLKQMGMRIGSSTGYTAQMMEIVVAGAKEQGYEPELWCCAEHLNQYGRPYPYMIFKNMYELGIDSVNSVIKVGDTQSDIAEGLAAGVLTVGVIEGSSEMGLNETEWLALNPQQQEQLREQTRQKFMAYGAHHTINNFSELVDLIETLNMSANEKLVSAV